RSGAAQSRRWLRGERAGGQLMHLLSPDPAEIGLVLGQRCAPLPSLLSAGPGRGSRSRPRAPTSKHATRRTDDQKRTAPRRGVHRVVHRLDTKVRHVSPMISRGPVLARGMFHEPVALVVVRSASLPAWVIMMWRAVPTPGFGWGRLLSSLGKVPVCGLPRAR